MIYQISVPNERIFMIFLLWEAILSFWWFHTIYEIIRFIQKKKRLLLDNFIVIQMSDPKVIWNLIYVNAGEKLLKV